MHKLEIINNWLLVFFKIGLGSGLVLILQKIYRVCSTLYQRTRNADNIRDADIQLLKVAIMSQLHDTIYRLTDEYITRGYITLDELDNLEYIFTSYQALGGNGSGEYRFMKVKDLPIKAGSDPILDELIQATQGGEDK